MADLEHQQEPGEDDRQGLDEADGGILVRQEWLGHRPIDADGRVVPANPRLGGRVVRARRQILDLGEIRQRAEASREARRRPEMAWFLSGRLQTDPATQGWRSSPNVDRHDESPAQSHAHQLAHGRVPLEMQPTHHVAGRPGLVELNESIGQPQAGEQILPIDLHEEAAVVGEALGHDDLDFVDRGRFDGERFVQEDRDLYGEELSP